MYFSTTSSIFLRILLSTSLLPFANCSLKKGGSGLVISVPKDGPVISLPSGVLILGKASDSTTSRFRIPCAKPPINALRLVDPVKFVPKSYVKGGELPPNAVLKMLEKSFRLNPAAKLPVLFWIHGGSFIGGSANLDASALPSQENVVVVLVQYRLGVLGFLKADYQGIEGNFGLKDIIMALTYVQDTIVHFGGDPTRVTVAGQYSGGEIIASLLVTPAADALFSQAIIQSAHLDLSDQTPEIGNAIGQLFLSSIKTQKSIKTVMTLSILQSLSVEDLLVAQNNLIDSRTPGYAGNVPGASLAEPVRTVVDGKLVPRYFGIGRVVFAPALPAKTFAPILSNFIGSDRAAKAIASGVYTPSTSSSDIRPNLISLISDFSWVFPAQEIALNLTARNYRQKNFLRQFNVGLPMPSANSPSSLCQNKPIHE